IIGHLCKMEERGKDVYQRDFENDFGITRSTASKVLQLLEKKGMIERVSVSHDGRMKKILLTDKSREIGRQMHKEFTQTEKQLTKGFSPEELQTLCGFLDRIQANIDISDKGEGRDEIC
ncbi:MAG: MarR family transcriptional regulator, partial [Oscillospiraceae bacterium]|nr:MarR family transcriptional regulator [Oscillospiraceae bacterium]